jgi:glycosyltransferase involved in cell wall biosynthesis
MLGEFPTLMIAAKQRGLEVVSEVYILLSTERILAEERRRFAGWESDHRDLASIRREFFANDALLTYSDFFVCPSEAVRNDLILNHGVAAQTAAVIPYGMDPRFLELRPKPRRGRVLFAGTAELRKGIHYLAMAAEKLAGRKPSLDFIVAGNVSQAVAGQPVCRHLAFQGRVPYHRIHEEFQTADVFVLPTLAEGSAEVIYEALAAGLPVITTQSAGSVVRDGIEGKIVPERDPDALAAAIDELVEDRAMRNRMAVAARERARNFTWDRYGERLLFQLRSLPH